MTTAPTVADIRGWPATVSVAQACTVFGVSESHGYDLIREGDFPVAVIRLGSRVRVVTTSILDAVAGGWLNLSKTA